MERLRHRLRYPSPFAVNSGRFRSVESLASNRPIRTAETGHAGTVIPFYPLGLGSIMIVELRHRAGGILAAKGRFHVVKILPTSGSVSASGRRLAIVRRDRRFTPRLVRISRRMIHSRRVCLLIDTSTSWGSRLIKGVSRHAQEVGDWLIHVEPWGRYERFRVPQGWEGHGIIARINHQTLADEIAATGLPTINLSWYPFCGERIARCTVDPLASGQMAAEYFLSAGHKQFAFCGPLQQLGYRDEFGDSFRDALKKKGLFLQRLSDARRRPAIDSLEHAFGQPGRMAQAASAAGGDAVLERGPGPAGDRGLSLRRHPRAG